MSRVPTIDDKWIRDCMRWHGRVLTGKFAHWCEDWDGWPMDADMIEFATCSCYSGNHAAEKLRAERRRELDEINERAEKETERADYNLPHLDTCAIKQGRCDCTCGLL